MKKRNALPSNYSGYSEALYPKFHKFSLYVPGWDGTRLAVDVVLPADEAGNPAKGPFPVVSAISRGGRFDAQPVGGFNVLYTLLAHGYALLIPELRGCGASHGVCDSFASQDDRRDVRAIFDWAATQPWCNGNIGTWGGSNRGLIQEASAVCRPAPSPALKAITPVVCNPDFYYQDYPNGVSALPSRKVHPGLSGPEGRPAMKTREEVFKRTTPVDADPNGDEAYEAYCVQQYPRNKAFMSWLLLPNMCRDDGNPNFNGDQTNITIPPITDIDVFKKSGIRMHQMAGFMESGAFGQLMARRQWGGTIFIGPWDHRESRSGTRAYPDANFQSLGGNPQDIASANHLFWFDHVLKGIDNGFDRMPPICYYTVDAPEGAYWRFAEDWPVDGCEPKAMYLSPALSGTMKAGHDGSLSFEKPAPASTDYRVRTDIQVFDNGEGATIERMHFDWTGDMTPGVDEKGLTFTSEVLPERTWLCGCTSADLWVSSTAPDGDFLLYLEEVEANGRSRFLAMGCQRASHRTSAPNPDWEAFGATYHPSLRADVDRCLAEGMDKPVHLQFHIEPISKELKAGSRLRITLTCADERTFQHPMYDPENLPTITLYQGGETASFVKLPFTQHRDNVLTGTVTNAAGETFAGSLYCFDAHSYLYYDGIWEKFAPVSAADNDFTFTDHKGQSLRFHAEGKAADGVVRQ